MKKIEKCNCTCRMFLCDQTIRNVCLYNPPKVIDDTILYETAPLGGFCYRYEPRTKTGHPIKKIKSTGAALGKSVNPRIFSRRKI